MKKTLLTCVLTTLSISAFAAPFDSIPPIDSSDWAVNPVTLGMTAEQFIEAESLNFMAGMAARNGINQWFHFTSLAAAEDRWVVSPNNDVIYSLIIVDASKGFTLELPDTGDRYISVQIISQEHMSTQFKGAGTYRFTGKEFEGSHVVVGIRVGTDGSKEDIKTIVEKIQPQMKLIANSNQPVPSFDRDTLMKVRAGLMAEYDKMDDTFGLMTDKVTKVKDWERFVYAMAGAWGLSEDQYAMYIPYALKGVKASECYVATYPQPKVKYFWSITAYNHDKYLMSNQSNIVNTGNVKLNKDNTFTVHFGACDGVKGVKNHIMTTEDNWSFLMRAYGADVEAFKHYQMPDVQKVVK
ncbi:TPA: DUF1254 domain-containing protein [Vibrio vulnificus]|nr:DUF1254 domain-containing protein [Vibrio vulnificus]HDY7805596.1 DUF1254 domain-containing protein [Vibrio vulnificus]